MSEIHKTRLDEVALFRYGLIADIKDLPPGTKGIGKLLTDKASSPVMAGVGIGAALAACHLIGIGLTGTSVNPARSFGPALFAGGTALSQVWVFLLAPAIGGLLAAVIYPLTRAAEPAAEPAPDPAAS